MRNRKNKGIIIPFIIFGATLSALFLVLFLCHNLTHSAKFTTDAWISASADKKYHYVDDLLENYQLIGKSAEEIKTLLGKPYHETKKGDFGYQDYVKSESDIDMFWYYRIEDNPLDGWRILLIKYKNDIVIEVEKTIENPG